MTNHRKKGKQVPATKDQHKSKNMIRLTDEMYAALRERARQNGRPMAWELRIILGQILGVSATESKETER
jgi:hypothetical protein